MRTILQIVPRLPPSANGVGDYATLLAGELGRRHAIRTLFQVTDPGWLQTGESPPVQIERLRARHRDVFIEQLNALAPQCDGVLLHYVGYGHDRRGCPRWLVDGLAQWKQSPAATRLIVMFHELYARGPIWTRSFWSSPVQQSLARQLSRLADRRLTNQAQSARWLNAVAPGNDSLIPVLPVFSNVGESAAILPGRERLPYLVVFGGGRWLEEALGKWREPFARACQVLRIEKVLAIGDSPLAPHASPVPVERLGVLPADDVRAWLARARAGFLGYHNGYLAKSGIFAAYCAHGLPTIMPEANDSSADGLRQGEHYLVADDLGEDLPAARADQIAKQAHRWYQGHDVRRTATRYAATMDDPS